MTVRELFERLGVANPGNDIDEAVRWALIELLLRRQAEKEPSP